MDYWGISDGGWRAIEVISTAIAGIGTLFAVAVSIAVARTARKDAKDEASRREAAENFTAELQQQMHAASLEYDQRLIDVQRQMHAASLEFERITYLEEIAQRQAIAVILRLRVDKIPAAEGENVREQFTASVINGSGSEISEVLLCCDSHARHDEISHILVSKNRRLDIVGELPHPGAVLTAFAEFTDVFGDRWRLDTEGTLTLLTRRRVRYLPDEDQQSEEQRD